MLMAFFWLNGQDETTYNTMLNSYQAETYSDYFYKIQNRKKPERNIEDFKNRLPILIKRYKEKQEEKILKKILLLIDSLILRMINQLREKWPYLKRAEMSELYNTSIIALHNACITYEIRDKNSIYSFPIYLKTYINREFKKNFFTKNHDSIEYDDSIENVAQYKHDYASEFDQKNMVNTINNLIYKGMMTPQYACILKLRIQNKSSSFIAKRMHVSVARVSFLYKKAVKILRVCFKNDIEIIKGKKGESIDE